jgi:hypothetical protein
LKKGGFSARIYWNGVSYGAPVRNRAGFDPGLIRFRFVFSSLWRIAPQLVTFWVRFRAAFGSFLVRFRFDFLRGSQREDRKGREKEITAGGLVTSSPTNCTFNEQWSYRRVG